MQDGFKTCPFCQEKIRARAIKCRFCGERVEMPPRGMDRSWIEIEGRPHSSAEAQPKPLNLAECVARHWHGELSFGLSFWIITVLLTGASVLTAFFATPLFRDHQISEIPGSVFIFYAVWPLIFLWQIVGAWRNAALLDDEQSALQNKAAKLCLLALSVGAAGLLGFKMIPQAAEYCLSKWHYRRVLPHQIQANASGTELEFRGGLEPGAAAHFRSFLDHLPSLKLVHLNSTGGRIDEALQIAQKVAERRLSVHVADRCFGTAALILLAGAERTAAPDARISFERADVFYRPPARRQYLEALALSTFREAGVNKTFATRALTTPHGETWSPTLGELRVAGVLTASECAEKDTPAGD